VLKNPSTAGSQTAQSSPAPSKDFFQAIEATYVKTLI
jgi:hypothetical protein